MEVKEFERLLQLRESYKKHLKEAGDKDFDKLFEFQEELNKLQSKLRRFVFQDQDALDNTLLKMKITLNNLGSTYSGYGSYSEPGKALNEIKAVREILYIIDTLERIKQSKLL